MKITSLSVERLELELSQPYTIAYETVSRSTNFILHAKTDVGIDGFGCAAPDEVVTYETADDVADAIRAAIEPSLVGQNPFAYARIIHELKQSLGRKSSSLAMADMLLFDLMSRKAGVPLYQFLGGYRDSIPTSITIGIMPPDEMLKQAHEFVKQGFTIIKLKGGLDVEEDIEKILRLRETFPEVILRFDGNQGYSASDSIRFCEKTAKATIEIFEQPTSITEEGQLGEVTGTVTVPVMADESLKSLSDVFRLASNNRIDMINIKLMKVGGILEGTHINSVAKSAGMEVMVGCLDECALGIAAGLHFALSRPNIEYADLDGHLDLLNDPFDGLFRLDGGVLRPTGETGLGKPK